MTAPKRCTDGELAKVGVKSYPSGSRSSQWELECQTCSSVWYPPIPGRYKHNIRGYWKCPNGCNTPDATRK